MSWTDIKASHTELGETMVVAQPAVTIELYGDAAVMGRPGCALLDRFLAVLPKNTELYVFDFGRGNSRQYKRLTSAALKRVRAQLADGGGRLTMKNAPGFSVNGYSLELGLGSEQSYVNDYVQLALPVICGEQPYAPTVEKLFTELITDFPFWAGVASYGFDLVWGREFEQSGMHVNMETARRYHGMTVRDRDQEYRMEHTIKMAGWLTFLDQERVQAAGGEAVLREAVSAAGIQVLPVRDGLLFRTGPTPPLGDVNRQEPELEKLRAVNQALAKVVLQRWEEPSLWSWDNPEQTREVCDAWLHRFEP